MSSGPDWLGSIGLQLHTAVAGLIGGILSLSMMPRLTFRKAVTAVIGGGASAAYMTPLAVEYLSIGSRNLENGLAFGLGIVGMNMIGGAFKLSERWRDDPSLDLDSLKRPPKDRT